MKTAIVVGHDQNEQGAFSPIINMTEYAYNCELANLLCHDFDIYYRPYKGGYARKMSKLANNLNRKDYDVVIELHFNMFDGLANKKGHGAEAVIMPGNLKSMELSKTLLNEICHQFQVSNRGIKEHGPGDRGYGFLSKMKANAIILEPFFGDELEAKKFLDFQKYANVLKSVLL